MKKLVTFNLLLIFSSTINTADTSPIMNVTLQQKLQNDTKLQELNRKIKPIKIQMAQVKTQLKNIHDEMAKKYGKQTMDLKKQLQNATPMTIASITSKFGILRAKSASEYAPKLKPLEKQLKELETQLIPLNTERMNLILEHQARAATEVKPLNVLQIAE